MAFFPMSYVLRGFPFAAYAMYAFLSRYAGNENPCAALLIEKISHLANGNCSII